MMNCLQKKKLAFMSIVNRVKGFVRNITGTLPLTLEGCVDEESIIDYTLYGQSVQNGTPTPETPVEVESVGEYDETTGKYKIPIKVSGKNLYNKNIDEKIVINASGTTRYGVKINSCNEPITVSGLYTQADFIAYKTIKDGIYSTYRDMPILPHTITDTGDTLVLYLGAETSKFSERISNLQIEYGYTATDYEPYHETTTNIYLDEPLGEGQSINYKRDGLPNLPTFKGTSIISADTTIQPSNVEITYYSNVKE